MIKIVIASGKGGTGKTFVATNIFFSLIKNNSKAMLIDCDAEAPNAIAFFNAQLTNTEEIFQQSPVIDENKCTYCGKCHDWCNYNAIFILPKHGVIKVIEDLCHGCGACFAACEYGAITEKEMALGQVATYLLDNKHSLIESRMDVGVMSPVRILKAALKKIDQQDEFVIMDAPPGTSCPFIQTTASADFVVLVTEPTPFGLSDLKQSVETLKIMNKPYGVIINRAGLGNQAVYEYLKQENIPLLMEIPFDRNIATHYSKGKLVAEEMPEYREKFVHLVNDSIKNILNKK